MISKKLVENELQKELNETNRINNSGLSSFSSSNALSQTLTNLQIILNNNSNNLATATSTIQLDPHVLTNQSNNANKTIKQLTNEQQTKNQSKTTTVLLSSPVEFRQQQQQQANESNPTTTLTLTSKESNEINYSTVNISHENDIEMKSDNTNSIDTKENSNTSKVQGIRKLKIQN